MLAEYQQLKLKIKNYSERVIRKNFTKIKKELGLNEFKLDDLRHTFAYNFLKQNNSLEKLHLQLGNSTIRATIEKYNFLL